MNTKYLEDKDMEVINNIEDDITMGTLQAAQRINQHKSAHSWSLVLASTILQTQL